MDTKNIPPSLSYNERSALTSFFSDQTVEGQYLLEKFTPKMIAEVFSFESFFNEFDIKHIMECTNPTDCLYVVASIISRIRGEKAVQRNPEIKETSFTIEEIQQKVGAIFEKP